MESATRIVYLRKMEQAAGLAEEQVSARAREKKSYVGRARSTRPILPWDFASYTRMEDEYIISCIAYIFLYSGGLRAILLSLVPRVGDGASKRWSHAKNWMK